METLVQLDRPVLQDYLALQEQLVEQEKLVRLERQEVRVPPEE